MPNTKTYTYVVLAKLGAALADARASTGEAEADLGREIAVVYRSLRNAMPPLHSDNALRSTPTVAARTPDQLLGDWVADRVSANTDWCDGELSILFGVVDEAVGLAYPSVGQNLDGSSAFELILKMGLALNASPPASSDRQARLRSVASELFEQFEGCSPREYRDDPSLNVIYPALLEDDETFDRKLEEAMNDDRPGIPHEEVAATVRAAIRNAARDHR